MAQVYPQGGQVASAFGSVMRESPGRETARKLPPKLFLGTLEGDRPGPGLIRRRDGVKGMFVPA